MKGHTNRSLEAQNEGKESVRLEKGVRKMEGKVEMTTWGGE